ncbi:hypothetical protein DIPPA_12550 [Diplonema papillatum]|nr:hypothetical protein DIPPA_12550 [Diplonema papillatum]
MSADGLSFDIYDVWDSELTVRFSAVDWSTVQRVHFTVVPRSKSDVQPAEVFLEDPDEGRATATVKAPWSDWHRSAKLSVLALVGPDGSGGTWVKVGEDAEVSFLGDPVVVQTEVDPARVKIRWHFPLSGGLPAAAYAMITHFTVVVTQRIRGLSASPVKEMVFETEPSLPDAPQEAVIPELKPHCIYSVSLRFRRSTPSPDDPTRQGKPPKPGGGKSEWTKWTQPVDCAAIYPVSTTVDEISYDHLKFSWRRSIPAYLQACPPEFATKVLEYRAALDAGDPACPLWERSFEPRDGVPAAGSMCVADLQPDTHYALRITCRSAYGEPVTESHLVRTAPALIFERVRKLTAVSIDVAWTTEDRRRCPHTEERLASMYATNRLSSPPISAVAEHILSATRQDDAAKPFEVRTRGDSSDGCSARLEGLDESTAYTLRVRQKTASGTLTRWSRPVSVRTLEKLRPQIVQRGTSFVDVRWQRSFLGQITRIGEPGDPPAALVDAAAHFEGDSGCEARKIVSARRPRFADRAIADATLPSEDPQQVVVGIELSDPPLAGADAALDGEFDIHWGRAAAQTQLIRAFDAPFGTTRFTGLSPGTAYRVSLNEHDSDGLWYGRTSSFFATLDATFAALPAADDAAAVEPVLDVSAASRQLPPRAAAAAAAPPACDAPRDRAFSVAVGVAEIGESHAVLSWSFVDPQATGAGAELRGAGDDALEYQLMLLRRPCGGGGAVGPSETRKFYCRVAGTTARVTGLLCLAHYEVAMAVFSRARGAWSRWSERTPFSTMRGLTAKVHALHRTGCVVGWSRDCEANQRDTGIPAKKGVANYALRTTDLITSVQRVLSLNGTSHPRTTRFTLNDLTFDSVHRVVVAPEYSNGAVGVVSNPVHILYHSLAFAMTSVGENTATLSWRVPPFDYVSSSKIIASLETRADAARQDVELPVSAEAYTFTHVRPDTGYRVHILLAGEVSAPTAAQLAGLMRSQKARAAKPAAPLGDFRTPPRMRLSLVEVRGDRAAVQWAKVDPFSFARGGAGGAGKPPPPAKCVVTYEVHTTVCATLQNNAATVSPAATSPWPEVVHTVQGLLPGTRYLVKVRWKLACGKWSSFSNAVFLTTPPTLALRVSSSGEDFIRIGWSAQSIGGAAPICTTGPTDPAAAANPDGWWDDGAGPPPSDTVPLRGPCPVTYCVCVEPWRVVPSSTASLQTPLALADASFPYPEFVVGAAQKNAPGKSANGTADPDGDTGRSEPSLTMYETHDTTLLVDGLAPNAMYSVTVLAVHRQSQQDAPDPAKQDSPGTSRLAAPRTDLLRLQGWCPKVRAWTLPAVSARVVARGSNYVRVQWNRRARPSLQLAHSCNEYVSVAEAAAATESGGSERRETRYERGKSPSAAGEVLLDDLRPDSKYTITVRLGYSEERVAGNWTDSLTVRTLRLPMLKLDAADDSFIRVILSRPLHATAESEPVPATLRSRIVETACCQPQLFSSPPLPCAAPDPPAGDVPLLSAWQIRVSCADGTFIDDRQELVLSIPPAHLPNTPRTVATEQPTLHAIPSLCPDTLYKISCRYVDEWEIPSAWSADTHVSTLPVVKLLVTHVAENFVCAQWLRPDFGYVENPFFAGLDVVGDKGCDLRWEFVVFDGDRSVQKHTLPGDVTSLMVKDLCSSTRYTLLLRGANVSPVVRKPLLEAAAATPLDYHRPSDVLFDFSCSEEPGAKPPNLFDVPWGSWSSRVYATTLEGVVHCVSHVGQDYLTVSWCHPGAHAPPSVAAPLAGPMTSGDDMHASRTLSADSLAESRDTDVHSKRRKSGVVRGRPHRSRSSIAPGLLLWQPAQVVEYEFTITKIVPCPEPEPPKPETEQAIPPEAAKRTSTTLDPRVSSFTEPSSTRAPTALLSPHETSHKPSGDGWFPAHTNAHLQNRYFFSYLTAVSPTRHRSLHPEPGSAGGLAAPPGDVGVGAATEADGPKCVVLAPLQDARRSAPVGVARRRSSPADDAAAARPVAPAAAAAWQRKAEVAGEVRKVSFPVVAADGSERAVFDDDHVFDGNIAGLEPGAKYSVMCRAVYRLRPGEQCGGGEGDDLRVVTLGALSLKLGKIEDVSAVMLVQPPRTVVPLTWAGTVGANPQGLRVAHPKRVRDLFARVHRPRDYVFDVSCNGVTLPESITLDIASPSAKVSVSLGDLRRDCRYVLRTREKNPGTGAALGGWIEVHRFHTRPHTPAIGKLVEWKNGVVGFTLGVHLDNSAEPLFDDKVPAGYQFCVEVKIHGTQNWYQGGIVRAGRIRTPLDAPLPQCSFRVKAANHSESQYGVQVPLWGAYSQPKQWKEPPRPTGVAALRVQNLKAKSALIVWEKPTNFSTQQDVEYHVFTATASASSGNRVWQLSGQVQQPAFNLPGLSPNTTYRVCVQAVSGFGSSVKSTPLTFTTNIDTSVRSSKASTSTSAGGTNREAPGREQAKPPGQRPGTGDPCADTTLRGSMRPRTAPAVGNAPAPKPAPQPAPKLRRALRPEPLFIAGKLGHARKLVATPALDNSI